MPQTVLLGTLSPDGTVLDETTHLTCYELERAAGAPELFEVDTSDRWGFLTSTIRVGAGETLCVPSTKEH